MELNGAESIAGQTVPEAGERGPLSSRAHNKVDLNCDATREKQDQLGDCEGPITRFKGVQWDKKGKRWRARLHTDRTRHVGYYLDDIQAAKAWDQAFLRYNSEVSIIDKLNFPEESYAAFKKFISTTGDVDLCDLRGVTGVTHGQFRAVILQNRVQKTVGTYPTARQAAVAYDWKAISLQGWGALTNFPIKSYQMEYVQNGGISPLDRTVLPPLQSQSNNRATEIQQSMFRMQDQIYPGGMPPDALQRLLQQSPNPMTSEGYQEQIRQLCTILSIPPDQIRTDVNPKVAEQKVQDAAPQERTLVSKVTDNQWRASITIDLGVFSSKEKAEIACKRSRLVADGYGSVTDPLHVLEHFEGIKDGQNEKKNSITEKDGSYYAKLRIKQRAFELGPYSTFEEAAVAHDKYKLVIDGMVADTFNSLVHILLSEDDATMLLEALNLNPSTMSKPQQQTPTSLPYKHPALLRVGSMSNIVAPLPVSGLSIPRVGSQTSLQEGAIELQKQLEEIESSIEGIQGHKRTKTEGHGTPEQPHKKDSATPSVCIESQNYASMTVGQISTPPTAVDTKGGPFPLPAYPKRNNSNAQE